jgi:hypothetical protein
MAYLGSAAGVELLTRYFARSDTDFWLHVDAASDAAEYQALADHTPNLRLAAPRLRCWWGGFNGAVAVLAMAEAALNSKRYDRLIYLTEDSVPLLQLQELLAHLSEDIEYIELTRTEPDPLARRPRPRKMQEFLNQVRARYDGFYCYDCNAMNYRHVDYHDWVVTPAMEIQIARLARLRARGKARLRGLWHGPAYWALSAGAVTAILREHRKNVRLRESFEFSAMPEEQYYHTILGNSRRQRKTAAFMLMDFTREQRPFVFTTGDQLAELQSCGQLFARKVDFRSRSVIEFVELLA